MARKFPPHLKDKISTELKTEQRTACGAAEINSIAQNDYVDFLLANGRELASGKAKIVLDCANGSASTIAPALFRRLGVTHPDQPCRTRWEKHQ